MTSSTRPADSLGSKGTPLQSGSLALHMLIMEFRLTSSSAVPINSRTLVDRTYGAWSKRRLTGTIDNRDVNEAGADSKECVTPSTELNSVLRVNEVQGCLGDSVGHRGGPSKLLNEPGITGSARDVDNLLLGTLFDQRKESVGNGDRSDNVGPVLFHGSDVNYSGLNQSAYEGIKVVDQEVILADAGRSESDSINDAQCVRRVLGAQGVFFPF